MHRSSGCTLDISMSTGSKDSIWDDGSVDSGVIPVDTSLN